MRDNRLWYTSLYGIICAERQICSWLRRDDFTSAWIPTPLRRSILSAVIPVSSRRTQMIQQDKMLNVWDTKVVYARIRKSECLSYSCPCVVSDRKDLYCTPNKTPRWLDQVNHCTPQLLVQTALVESHTFCIPTLCFQRLLASFSWELVSIKI